MYVHTLHYIHHMTDTDTQTDTHTDIHTDIHMHTYRHTCLLRFPVHGIPVCSQRCQSETGSNSLETPLSLKINKFSSTVG